jgi:integrase
MRRQEMISLHGRDVKADDVLILTNRIKGGTYVGREVDDPQVKETLFDYLRLAKRLDVFRTDGQLWTRHDKAGRAGAPLSSHSYVKNLKRYAKEAGLEKFHMHQTKHTFARIVAEETGSPFDLSLIPFLTQNAERKRLFVLLDRPELRDD